MNEIQYHLTDHAKIEMERRSIPIELIESTLFSPGQRIDGANQRKIFQKRFFQNEKNYLLRLIVKETIPLTVITVYRTSKIDKYWR